MLTFKNHILPQAGIALLLLVTVVAGIAGCATAASGDTTEFKAEVVTGANRQLGQPLFRFDFMPPPFQENFGFEMLGVYNQGSPDPLRLTADTPDHAVLATFVDADGVGPPPAVLQNVDPSLVNLPLRDVPTWVLPPNLMERATVPAQSIGPVIGATQAEPAAPITKSDWFKASGKMQVKCNAQGNSVAIRAKDLVPNRVYTVWGLWLDPSVPRFIPVPLGGAPNSFVTDSRGDATFERKLNFCPTEAALTGVDGLRLGLVEAHLHSDHIAYGAIPAPLAAGFPPGTVLHGQIAWNPGAGERK